MDGIKNQIVNVIKSNLGKHEYIDCNTPLSEYGIDSLTTIELVLAIEEIYNFEFETEKLTYDTLRTVNSIAQYVSFRLDEVNK